MFYTGSRYDCDKCDYSSLNPEELKAHITTDHRLHQQQQQQQQQQQPQLQYACPKCDFKATSPDYLKIHVEREHQVMEAFSFVHSDLYRLFCPSVPYSYLDERLSFPVTLKKKDVSALMIPNNRNEMFVVCYQ